MLHVLTHTLTTDVIGGRLLGRTHLGIADYVFMYVVDGILFMDIVVSLRTAIATPHGILSTFVV